MAMQAVLLSWLKAVHVAMELVGLPDPFPNKTVLGKGLHVFERPFFHGTNPFLMRMGR